MQKIPMLMDSIVILFAVWAILATTGLLIAILGFIVIGSELLQFIAHARGYKYIVVPPERILQKRAMRRSKLPSL